MTATSRRKKVKQVNNVPVEADIPVQEDDAVLLKVDHTHAGTLYKAGTPVKELNPSESTLGFMKVRDII